jgi:hypothetical protein
MVMVLAVMPGADAVSPAELDPPAGVDPEL